MHIHFSKVARGPAWERWAILEEQHGDAALAGEAILTYTDTSTYAELQCDILFARELDESEVEEVLDLACSILSGHGSLSLHTTRQVICKRFSLMEEADEESPN